MAPRAEARIGRTLLAFLWLRWRMLVNQTTRAQGRDLLERLSRVLALLAPAAMIVFSGGLVLAGGALGLAGGLALGRGAVEVDAALVVARALVFVAFAIMIVASVLAGPSQVTARYGRLVLLPMDRRLLHLIEVAGSLVEPGVGFLPAAALALALGLLATGKLGAALVALAAGASLGVLLIMLGSAIAFLMGWLLRSRRRAELFTLITVIALCGIALAPALLTGRIQRDAAAARERGEELVITLPWAGADAPAWTALLPPQLYTTALDRALAGRTGAALLAVLALCVQAALVYGASSHAYRRLVASVASGGARRRTGESAGREPRLPGLTESGSAVALAQVRTALRSVRGRLIVLLPGPMLAVIALISRRVPDLVPGGSFLGSHGYVVWGAGIVFGLYALQAFTMNQLASDRAGLTLQFLAPLSATDLVRGKAAGCGILAAVIALVCLACALPVAAGGAVTAWLAVGLGGAATYLLMSPIGALVSAMLPVASDLSKTGPGGNPHGMALLLGSALVLVCSSPTALILAVAHHQLGRPWLALALTATWTAIAAAIAIALLPLAARAVDARRENLLLVAQGR